MAKDVVLNVVLNKNRNDPGWLRVEIAGVTRAQFRVLGRGSTTVGGKSTGNPTRNPFLYAGDTPTGNYTGTGLLSTDPKKRDSYGPWGKVQLKAVSGDALIAERLGRTGLLIHGGAEGQQFGGYRPTLGCLRLHNQDMKTLTDLLFSAGDDERNLVCGEVAVTVNVIES